MAHCATHFATKLIDSNRFAERKTVTVRHTVDSIVPHNMFQPCRIPKTEERGITMTQLCDVYGVIDGQSAAWRAAKRFGNQLLNLSPKDINLYHVNDNWITVKSKPYKCSYVELVAFGPQFPLWFISQ